ncbi:unnamed protein product [Rotaria sp. Silwood1]|nr:unnamed protein product [Rotaria sp. Silwood1]
MRQRIVRNEDFYKYYSYHIPECLAIQHDLLRERDLWNFDELDFIKELHRMRQRIVRNEDFYKYYSYRIPVEQTLIRQLSETITDLADELVSMCGINYLLSFTDIQRILDHDLTLELLYALSEYGDLNEKIHVKPQLIQQKMSIFLIRHGYNCYKMRS